MKPPSHLTVTKTSLCCLLAAGSGLMSGIANAQETTNLGTITVESSTITDLGDSRTEVSSTSIIDEQTIEIIDPKQINQVLRTIPGITSDVRDGEIVEIHMRGVGQQEFMWEDTGVAVVIDGVPVKQLGGKVRLNLSNIESIKVIKGGASYLYGNTALAGAVIITTKKPKNTDAYSLKAEYGSFNYQDYVATMQKGDDRFALTLNANYRETDGYWVDSALWNKSINGQGTWYIDDSSDLTLGIDLTNKYEQSSRAAVTGVTAAKENPKGIDDGTLSYQKDNYVDLYKVFLTYSKDFSNDSNLMVSPYYYQDNYEFLSTPFDSTTGTADGPNQDSYGRSNEEDLSQTGIKLEYRGTYAKAGYMIGLDIGQKSYDDRTDTIATYVDSRGRTQYAGEYSLTNDDEDSYALYGEIKYEFMPKWTATGNIRLDRQEYDYTNTTYDYDGAAWSTINSSASDSFNNTSYRLGLAYALRPDTTFYGNLSTGFRNPRVQDIYAGDMGRALQNNLNLDVETTINYEIGVRGNFLLQGTKLTYEASAFLTDTNDIISKVDGTYYGWTPTMWDNVGDARNRGFEISLKSDRKKTWSFDLAYTYLDAYYRSHKPFTVDLDLGWGVPDPVYDITGNQLPRTSAHTIDLFVYYKPAVNWTVISEVYAKSSYYADETNLEKMPGYAFLNLQVRYEKSFANSNLELFARVDNLFDRQYYRSVYLFSDRNDDGVMNEEDASITVDPGRVFYAGMKYSF